MSATDNQPPAPFVIYERLRRETKSVAEVTEANIGQIAALIGGQVDYSGDTPALIAPGEKPWRVPVGWTVSYLGGDLLVNANGFNRDGDWWPAETPEES